MNLLFFFSLLIWGIESFSTAYITICAVVFSLYFIILTAVGGMQIALISLPFDIIPMGVFVCLGCPVVPIVIVTFVMHIIVFIIFKVAIDDLSNSFGFLGKMLATPGDYALKALTVVLFFDLLGMILALGYVL